MSLDAAVFKNQLKWQCRRGMLELDLWLNTFLDQAFDGLEEADQQAFVDFLKLEDVECYALLKADVREASCLHPHERMARKIRHALQIADSPST